MALTPLLRVSLSLRSKRRTTSRPMSVFFRQARLSPAQKRAGARHWRGVIMGEHNPARWNLATLSVNFTDLSFTSMRIHVLFTQPTGGKPMPNANARIGSSNHIRKRSPALVADIEDALGSARAFGRALELMGLGMRALEDDYSGDARHRHRIRAQASRQREGGLRANPRRGRSVSRPAPKQPTQIDAHIGARLRRLRLAREMAQAELGRRLGVSFMQVQKYESGPIASAPQGCFKSRRSSKSRSKASSKGCSVQRCRSISASVSGQGSSWMP